MKHAAVALLALSMNLIGPPAHGSDADTAHADSVRQLRDTVGTWDVVTEFIAPDGSITQSAPGTYEFEWVVPDRVLIGTSRIPDLDIASGLLFYIDSRDGEIEMVSVAGDGRLWVMSGPLGSETRYSEPYETADGGKAQLRFTRYDIETDRFESKMEYTTDGGQSWTQGNRQVFVRAGSAPPPMPAAEPADVVEQDATDPEPREADSDVAATNAAPPDELVVVDDEEDEEIVVEEIIEAAPEHGHDEAPRPENDTD